MQKTRFPHYVPKALNSDVEHIEGAIEYLKSNQSLFTEKLVPILARMSLKQDPEGANAEWARAVYRKNAKTRFLLSTRMRDIGSILESEGISWMPIKGMDTGERFFEVPEDRPVTDIDILVKTRDYQPARAALEASGWKSTHTGPFQDAYTLEEGYNWPASDSLNVVVELHFRLWGILGAGFVEQLWETARSDSTLGESAFRMSAGNAFIVCGIHYFLGPRPRQFMYLWELHRIAQALTREESQVVVQIACREGLQLPLAIVTRHTAELWNDESCRRLVDQLIPSLSWSERMIFHRCQGEKSAVFPLEFIYLARLMSRRPSRMGWRNAWRWFWPHPALVEQLTPENRSWTLRRILFMAQKVKRIIPNRKGGR